MRRIERRLFGWLDIDPKRGRTATGCTQMRVLAPARGGMLPPLPPEDPMIQRSQDPKKPIFKTIRAGPMYMNKARHEAPHRP